MAKTEPRSLILLGLLLIAPFLLAGCSDQGENSGAASVTVFEGVRVIVGDGSEPIEDGALVVQDDRVTQVGGRGEIQVPEGAVRVDLTGKTVMPAIINSHMHLGATREELVGQLEHNAYYGVGSVLSLGLDSSEVNLQVRNELIPNAARYRTAWKGITRPEEGRSEVPYWVDTEEEARAAVQDLAAQNPDFVKIWVDDRNGSYPKMTPALYGAEEPVTVLAAIPAAVPGDDSAIIEEGAQGVGEIEPAIGETGVALGIVPLELHYPIVGQ